MTVSTHKDLAGLNIHTPVTWEVADATARLAITTTSLDIHKIAWQLDTDEAWILIGTGPSVWKQFEGPAGPTGATGPAGAGVITGGTAGQVLSKIDSTDYNTQWHTLVKSDVGLSNADNTSDVNKPVSTAQATAIALKADIASPALTGNPTAPTQSPSDNSTKIATTAYVDAAASAVVAPDATTTTKGIVKLAGDLGGTAALPTVPALAGKEPTITATTSADYYRGDKTFQPLDKAAISLSNVDNTSDIDKPVSTAQQTALDLKANQDLSNLASTAVNTNILPNSSDTYNLGEQAHKWLDAYITNIRDNNANQVLFSDDSNRYLYDRTGSKSLDFADPALARFMNGLDVTGQISANTGSITNNLNTAGITVSGQTPSTVPYLDSGANLVSSSITPTQLSYLSGVTSSIQTQLNGKVSSVNTRTGAVTLTATDVSNTSNTSTGYLSLPVGTTAQQPASPAIGMLRYNSTTSRHEFYASGAWQNHARLSGDTFTGTVTVPTFNLSGATASTVPYLDASKNLVSSSVTPTQLGYLDATSSIQTQLNGKQATLTNPMTGTGVSGQVSFWNSTSSNGGNNNFFWDNTNSLLGVGTNTPASKIDVLDTALSGSGALSGSIINLAQTWNTTGSPTALKLNVTNTASGASSLLADFQVGAASKFSIDKTGGFKSAANGIALAGTTFASGQFGFAGGSSFTFLQSSGISGAGNATLALFSTVNLTATSGTLSTLGAGGSYTPSSGTCVINGFIVNPTINQSSGATGISRGIYINPTLTSAADFRGLEIANTVGFGVYQSGTSILNYFAGNVGIGLTSPSAKLDITDTTLSGSGALSGSALNIAQTWNTTGTPSAFKISITDTASNTLSNFAQFQYGGVTRLSIGKDGSVDFGAYGSSPGIASGNPTAVGTQVGGKAVHLLHYLTTEAGYGVWGSRVTTTRTPTTGETGMFTTAETFNPTSGAASYNGMSLATIINQVGSTGITRGLYVNPTLTAAADFRAVEFANNSGFGVYQSGASAKNYFAGTVGIGNTSPVNMLDVKSTTVSVTISAASTLSTGFSQLVAGVNDGTAPTFHQLTFNTSATGTSFGIARAGLGLHYADGTALTAMAMGTLSATPLVLGTNNLERLRIVSSGNIGIGVTSPNANAILDVASTTKAFMPPRMTTTQKTAIASPTSGMVVYDSTLNKLCVYGASSWETITSV